MILEVIALSLEDALAAQAGGAGTLEIVADPSVGGLTPSLEVVRAIRETIDLPLNVMVRPHARSFVYTPAEIETILTQTAEMVRAGADTIVFGALHPDGTLDEVLLRQVIQAAQPVPLTLHRAIDDCTNADSALDALHGLNVARVLSSGGAPDAWAGRDRLKAWAARHAHAFTLVCGGGIRAEHLKPLADYTGASHFHVGTAARTAGKVDAAKVRALVDLL